MFSPKEQATDLSLYIAFGRLIYNPLESIGISSLLHPAGLQNHAPQLCWVNSDLLACVWMAGGGEGTSGMSIYLSLLESNSQSWTLPQIISKDSTRSEQNPLLFVSQDSLHLIHSAQAVRDVREAAEKLDGSSFSMQWTALLRHQTISVKSILVDQRNTWNQEAWSEPQDLLPTTSFCRHPPQPLPSGEFLLPIYRSLETGGSFGHDYSQVLSLCSEGRAKADPLNVPNSIGRVHGSIAFSSNGSHLLQFFRSRLADNIYRSVSNDNGQNWSEPQATSLPNNNSSIQAIRLSSGRLAIIYNRFGLRKQTSELQPWGEANWPQTRWPLSIAISPDDGDNWPYIRDIDTGLGYHGTMNWTFNGQLAYPCILEGEPGELHIAYSWAGREAIRYVCLREDDIIGFITE